MKKNSNISPNRNLQKFSNIVLDFPLLEEIELFEYIDSLKRDYFSIMVQQPPQRKSCWTLFEGFKNQFQLF